MRAPLLTTVCGLVAATLATLAMAQERVLPTAIPGNDTPPPWVQAGPPLRKLPVQEIAGPRQFLELLNIDASQLDRFADRRPLHPDEYEPLYRILYQIPRFPRDALYRWRLRDIAWEDFADRPEDFRASSLRLTGRATRVERVDVLPEAAKVLEFDAFYRITLQPDNAPFPAIVCARGMPQAWKADEESDYRASVDGLFLKLEQTGDRQPHLLLACDRIAWHPDVPDAALGVTEDHVLLATQGMDLGQFDRVRDRTAITAAERECFYQLLDAVRRLDPKRLTQRTSDEADLGPLLQTPREVRGRQFAFVGQARRVQEIRVEESDIRQRFGIDHYYEIDVFVPLEQQSIKMGEGKDAPVFDAYYPVIFCVAQLPKGMKPEDLTDRQVRIPAFSFKLWAYETEFMRRYGDRPIQLSPMLLGPAPQLVVEPANPFLNAGTVASALFVFLLGVAWIWVWRMSKQDAVFDREERRRRFQFDQPLPRERLEPSPSDDGGSQLHGEAT